MNAINFLQSAIQSGDREQVEALIKCHPNLINAKDSRGFTPLIFAAYFGKIDIVKLLIENNADIYLNQYKIT
ncbi:ankyrin repeat domain-containing protein [Flavivirga sp. 57AJ16]|uniref:ankyrin repeat domain-containing protein n=1 Tax=Flavivirga sp. 57AJ16 TaxID=3025307 RepID=UPI0023654CA3|nr:ankyrin repeat domain-containing protein [Flavivirga sp. 57AJ16]MDD7886148.1 ankyrin repeat domain-containing protein [Flavivirga sp. 57AJ16]